MTRRAPFATFLFWTTSSQSKHLLPVSSQISQAWWCVDPGGPTSKIRRNLSDSRIWISIPKCIRIDDRLPWNALPNTQDLIQRVRRTLDKNRCFVKISDCRRHVANLSSRGKFAQGIESTQRMHFWIAYDLIKDRKLLRRQTNSQILRNLDFCVQNLHFFDFHVDARFLVL